MSLKNLSNTELIDSTRKALQVSREAEVNVLKHFREIEERRLWAHLSSLYEYLGQTFNLTSDQIYPRLQAMRLIVVVPEIEQKLEAGKLNITNVLKAHQAFRAEAKKRKVSTDEKRFVLCDLENKSTKAAEKVLAAKYPLTHKLPEKIKPVAKNLNIIQFYADDETVNEIENLKARYSHQMPDGKTEDLIKILIRIANRQPKPRNPSRFKTKDKPQTVVNLANFCEPSSKDSGKAQRRGNFGSNLPIDYRSELEGQNDLIENQMSELTEPRRELREGSTAGHAHRNRVELSPRNRITIKTRSRYIPADVKREMEKSRNAGCTHVGPHGERCGSLHFLQLDHIVEFRSGGANSIENLRWMCGFHNRNRFETKNAR